MLRRLVPTRIVLVLDLDASVEQVQFDPGQLDQVVVNLVVNSVDAMADAGTITVRTTACSSSRRRTSSSIPTSCRAATSH